MRVKAGQVVISKHLKLISGFAGFEAWRSLPHNQRLLLLEDIFQDWIEEHRPVREKDNVDTDLFTQSQSGAK